MLLDENLGRGIASGLSAEGHDVERAALLFPAARDDVLLAYARRTDRILVTFDDDFRDLVYRDSEPPSPAIIFLAFQPRPQLEALALIREALNHPSLRGSYVFADRDGLRFFPLPD